MELPWCPPEELQELLNPEDEEDSDKLITGLPQIEIAGVQIPLELENLGFFFVGQSRLRQDSSHQTGAGRSVAAS